MCSYKYGINKLHHDRLQYPDVHPLYTIYTKFHRNLEINENIQDGGHLGHFSSSYLDTRPLQMIRTKFHRNRSINKNFQYGGLLHHVRHGHKIRDQSYNIHAKYH